MGHTIEDARRELIEALEEWIAARLMWGLPIPPISGQSIEISKKNVAIVPYNPGWPKLFLEEKEHLMTCLPREQSST